MARPFDAATKHLIETNPADWLAYVGLPRAEVEILDADLSSVSAAGDKLLRVREAMPWFLHLELQAGYESDMIERFHFYCVVERRRHRLPVQLYVVLLRPEADGPDVTGAIEYLRPNGTCYERFEYNVIRAWEKPVEETLQGGLATLPLAPISNVRPEELPAVVRRMDERLSREVSPGEAEDLWTATYLLMGLRYPPEVGRQLLQGVRNMRESSTYQAILEEGRAEGEARGRAEEARRSILLIGRKRLGEPSPDVQARLDALSDVDALERLLGRSLDVETWEELWAGA
jgi:predicted transposase YdaD